MTIDRINPPGLHATPGYHHVTLVSGGRTAYLAGQCPLDADGKVVGVGEFGPQVDQIVANTLAALAAIGAGPEHVVRTVIYVVTDSRAVLADVWNRFTTSTLGAAFSTASTLVGVAQLGYEAQRVELDVTAALPPETA